MADEKAVRSALEKVRHRHLFLGGSQALHAQSIVALAVYSVILECKLTRLVDGEV